MVGSQSLHDFIFGEIHDGNAIADVLGDIQIISMERCSQSRRITRAGLVRLLLTKHNFAREFGGAVSPRVTEYRVVVAAGDVEGLPVPSKSDAQKRGRLFQRLGHALRLQVNDLY